jgi:hypothetical protein
MPYAYLYSINTGSNLRPLGLVYTLHQPTRDYIGRPKYLLGVVQYYWHWHCLWARLAKGTVENMA